MKKLLVGLTVAVGLVMVTAGAASAASSSQITLKCGNTTYQVTTNGNGDWTPARDTGSNLVFHPTAFGEFTGMFRPADGGKPERFTDPARVFKAQPANGHDTFDCTFTFTQTDDSGTFTGKGSVTGYFSGTA